MEAHGKVIEKNKKKFKNAVSFRLANTLEKVNVFSEMEEFFDLNVLKRETMQEYKGVSLDHINSAACK